MPRHAGSRFRWRQVVTPPAVYRALVYERVSPREKVSLLEPVFAQAVAHRWPDH